MTTRRGFLGRLLGLGAASAVDPSSILGLEGAYARIYPTVEPIEYKALSDCLRRTYGSGDYFKPFQEAYTPFLAELDRGDGRPSEPFWGARPTDDPGPEHQHYCSRCDKPLGWYCYGKSCVEDRHEPVVPPEETDLGWCMDCLDEDEL